MLRYLGKISGSLLIEATDKIAIAFEFGDRLYFVQLYVNILLDSIVRGRCRFQNDKCILDFRVFSCKQTSNDASLYRLEESL